MSIDYQSIDKTKNTLNNDKYILGYEEDINCGRINLIKVWQGSHARISRVNSTIKLSFIRRQPHSHKCMKQGKKKKKQTNKVRRVNKIKSRFNTQRNNNALV